MFPALFSEQLHYYQLRPEKGVLGNMWCVFMPPFHYKDHSFETVFVAGDSLADACVVDISALGPAPSADCIVHWSSSGSSSKKQCKVHRLLGFTFLYDGCYPPGGPYYVNTVVHHRDDHHDNNLLNNLRLMTKRDHDALVSRRS